MISTLQERVSVPQPLIIEQLAQKRLFAVPGAPGAQRDAEATSGTEVPQLRSSSPTAGSGVFAQRSTLAAAYQETREPSPP